MSTPAILALANGTVFHGTAIGASGAAVGEVVFNTAMTGYQEILTDPSYAEQIVTLTYPHIGNVGTNDADSESDRVWAKGLVIRDLSLSASNWRSTQSLTDYLIAQGVVAIADIDTRQLTHILRNEGAQGACILSGTAVDQAVRLAGEFAGLAGQNLASLVSTATPYVWSQACWPEGELTLPVDAPHVVALDFGIKRNILRCLLSQGCRVTVLPGNSTLEEILAYQPQGVFLSNGPGDPAACTQAIHTIKQLLQTGLPLFGICLGHQLLALACGARTFKMKFGHHGANHPVLAVHTGLVLISSQNHGFAVDEASLPPELVVTHRSLFDQTIQGIQHTQYNAFAFQGHPEASPGPHDVFPLFAEFVSRMRAHTLLEAL